MTEQDLRIQALEKKVWILEQYIDKIGTVVFDSSGSLEKDYLQSVQDNVKEAMDIVGSEFRETLEKV